MKASLQGSRLPCGPGYYLREPDSAAVYLCWCEKHIAVMPNAYPGHTEGTVARTGKFQEIAVACPVIIKHIWGGGVDKSDQYLAYDNILRRTVRYWKTLFYHLVDVAII